MVNLKSSRSEIRLFWKFTKKQPRNFQEQPFKNYFETVLPIILAAVWTICILLTISFLLWTITIISFNCTWENLDTMDDFNFTNFQLLLLSQSRFKPLFSEEIFVEWYKAARESSLWILLVLTQICLNLLVSLTF